MNAFHSDDEIALVFLKDGREIISVRGSVKKNVLARF